MVANQVHVSASRFFTLPHTWEGVSSQNTEISPIFYQLNILPYGLGVQNLSNPFLLVGISQASNPLR